MDFRNTAEPSQPRRRRGAWGLGAAALLTLILLSACSPRPKGGPAPPPTPGTSALAPASPTLEQATQTSSQESLASPIILGFQVRGWV